MKTVFLLQHAYERTPDTEEEFKLIRVYATNGDAEDAIERLSKQPGFCDFPEHFEIVELEIGQDHWKEGFSTEYYTPIWDVWAKDSTGMLSRIERGMTENEALQFVRDHEFDGTCSYFAKERR
jgi:hypothetical protein